MASSTECIWVWADSGRWWKTGKPGVLQSMRSRRVGQDWRTEQQISQGVLEMFWKQAKDLESLQLILKDGIWKTMNCKSHLDYFARASIKNTTHWARGLENWYLFFDSSGGWKSKIKVPPVLVFSEDSLCGLQMADLLLVLHTGHLSVPSALISHSSCKDTSHIRLEFHAPDTILTKSPF